MPNNIKSDSPSHIHKSTKEIYAELQKEGRITNHIAIWIISSIFTIVENLAAKSRREAVMSADINLIKRTLNLEIKDK